MHRLLDERVHDGALTSSEISVAVTMTPRPGVVTDCSNAPPVRAVGDIKFHFAKVHNPPGRLEHYYLLFTLGTQRRRTFEEECRADETAFRHRIVLPVEDMAHVLDVRLCSVVLDDDPIIHGQVRVPLSKVHMWATQSAQIKGDLKVEEGGREVGRAMRQHLQ